MEPKKTLVFPYQRSSVFIKARSAFATVPKIELAMMAIDED
jgi:hypothetical protein